MKEKFRSLMRWFDVTSRPFGWITFGLFLATAVPIGLQKSFFTGTCYLADWKCQYGFTQVATNAMSGLVSEVLSDNPDLDLAMSKKPKTVKR